MGKLKKWIVLVLICLAGFQVDIAVAQDNAESGRASQRTRSRRNDDSVGQNSRFGRGETTQDRERRRESRSRERESNSRSSASSRRSANGEEGGRTVEGAAKASSGGSSGSAGGARPPINITFEMQPDPETNIMYIESSSPQPSLNVNAILDESFVTRISLYNAKGSEFNQFDVSLKYDPQVMRPVAIDDSSLTGTLVKPSTIRVSPRRGILSMSGDFKDNRNDSFITLAKVQWEALAPTASTPIQFLNTEFNPSGIFNRYGQNILHAQASDAFEISANTGLLNASVTIEPSDGLLELESLDGTNPFSALTLATDISMGTAEGGMELALVPRQNAVSTDEEFLVDVRYSNPKRADLDTVKLEIRFDPTVLQVVDSDEGNWITRGVNIFDGAYHEELPFDYHRRNAAYNTTGRIEYEMGFSNRTPVPSRGTIATIRFKAIAPARETLIGFVSGSANGEAETTTSRQTAISFLGFNLIGSPGQRASSIHNAAINIQ